MIDARASVCLLQLELSPDFYSSLVLNSNDFGFYFQFVKLYCLLRLALYNKKQNLPGTIDPKIQSFWVDRPPRLFN